MGSLFRPKTPTLPPPPPKQELMDFIDETSGIEQRVVTRPDGKKEIVRKELPLTPEEQAFRDDIKNRLQNAFDKITAMTNVVSAYDVPEFQDQLKAFERNLKTNVDESFRVATKAQEEALARRGLSDSTAATESRRAIFRQRQKAEQQVRDRTLLQAEQLRAAEIARQQNLFGLASGQQQQLFNRGLQSSAFGQGLQTAQLSSQLAYNQALQQRNLQQANLQMQANSIGASAFGNLLGAAGTFAGGYFGSL